MTLTNKLTTTFLAASITLQVLDITLGHHKIISKVKDIGVSYSHGLIYDDGTEGKTFHLDFNKLNGEKYTRPEIGEECRVGIFTNNAYSCHKPTQSQRF